MKYRSDKNSGMTLMEILVVLTIILILVGAVITAANALRERAAVDLTKSMLDVLDTALQQYYDDSDDVGEKFPFVTHLGPGSLVPDTDSDQHWLDEFIGTYTPVSGTIPPNPGGANQTILALEIGSALFYYLDKNPASRQIAAAVSDSLITNKDANGTALAIELQTIPPEKIDLPRYIDAWGTTIMYELPAGAAFPKLTSAGPDKVFGDLVTLTGPGVADNVTNE